jgi:hypothetical protein
VTALSLDDIDIDVAENATQDVTATATPSGESANTRWSISDANVATISANQGASVTVTGKAAGQAVLKATNGAQEVLAIVTVS